MEREVESALDARTGTLELDVQWWDGTPADGVLLEALPIKVPQPFAELRHARSDAGGRARLPDLPSGRVWVRALLCERTLLPMAADMPEIVPEPHYYTVPGGRTVQGVLVLARGVDVHMRVVDASGKSIEYARIWCGAGWGLDRLTAVEIARTDSEGRASVRSLHPRYSILATDENGNASAEVSAERAQKASANAPHELVLDRQGTLLSGRVVDRSLQPLAGARVRVIASDPMVAAKNGSATDAMVLSAEDGRFAFAGLAPGRAHVFVDAPSHAPWTGEIALGPSGPAVLEVLLDEGFRAVGRLGSAGGEAITDGRVAARELLPGVWTFAWLSYYDLSVDADESGVYELRWLPAGQVELEARAGERAVESTLFGTSGDTVEWNPLFPAKTCIRGVALDEQGLPLADHFVVARSSPAEPRSQRGLDTRTALDGTFEICDLELIEYDLTLHEGEKWRPDGGVDFPDTRGWMAIERRVRPDSRPVVLRVQSMPDLGALVGRFVGSDGAPAGRGDLRVHARSFLSRVGVRKEEWIGDRFCVGPLEPGEYELVVLHPELGYARIGTVTIAPGEEKDLGDIPLALPGSLEVEIVWRQAEELLGPMFSVRPTAGTEDARVGAQMQGNRGRFEQLQPGEYLVTASARYGVLETLTATVRSGETTSLQVELTPGVAVWVKLALPASAAHSFHRAIVTVRSAEGDGEWTLGGGYWHSPSERFTAFGSLRPGRYTWQARGGEAIVAEGSFELTPVPKDQVFEAQILPAPGR